MARLLLKREQLHIPHLPPVLVAPILEHYDPEHRKIDDEYRIRPPQDG